jgi:hypothetical protein
MHEEDHLEKIQLQELYSFAKKEQIALRKEADEMLEKMEYEREESTSLKVDLEQKIGKLMAINTELSSQLEKVAHDNSILKHEIEQTKYDRDYSVQSVVDV